MKVDELAQFHQSFFEESEEHTRTLEARLLELEANPGDGELHNALFRAAHSIKGSSGILGFDTVTRLTHAMESVLDGVRSLKVRVDSALSSLLLAATDLLGAALDAAREKRPPPDIAPMVAQLDAAQGGAASASHAPAPSAAAADPGTAAPKTWHITFRPGARVFANGLDPAFALLDLQALGPCTVTALVDQLPALSSFDPETSYLGWRIELTTTRPRKDLDDIFLFMDDARELTFVEASTVVAPAPTAGFTAVPSSSPSGLTAPGNEGQPQGATGAHARKGEAASLRVSTEKVDSLINLVGELVISQAMISRSLATFTADELPRLREATAEMERHTRDLQHRVMNIRMIPIGTIFNRFRRLVRDLGEQLGKDIELQISGEETELDKSMVEALADPLTHLVRNAADHGLEPTDKRLATGKSKTGTLALAARHQGGNVVIEISDDGAGLNEERILARAIERGLVPAGASRTPEEIHQLIFAPGFSTAAAVTNLSGRGVGMDVVKRAVEALNGSIATFSSPGSGSRFRLTLPLTLAILDGMAVRVGETTWVIPLNQVIETLPLKQNPITQVPGQGEVLRVRGRTTALLRPSALLGTAADRENPRPLAVVCEAGDCRFALAVDELLGKSQFVIKSLEPNFQRLDGVLGATILGDGAVSFILDVPGLARLGRLTRLDDSPDGNAGTHPSPQELHA